MFWADTVAQDIITSGKYQPYWVDDMFTPSGYAHIGSLRGPLIHDIVYRALRDAGKIATFTYVFNDFDPIDGLPPDLPDSLRAYMGVPLRAAPSPNPRFANFAQYFRQDFEAVLTSLGFGATLLSSWDMYHEGRFNGVIREALDHAQDIQDIYQRVSGSKKREKGWLPLQVICEHCGKLGTTHISDWNGETVAYTCKEKLVAWATGCGYSGSVSPFDGRGKLPWKVDWPAHWKVMGVTVEGAGKDHATAGGSRDVARELCIKVFHFPEPFNVAYEHFLIGGKKMSSSKSLGLKARDFTGLLPPPVGRFLFARTDYRQAIEFDPVGTMAIPDLFDEYDRCWQAYNEGGDEDLARAFEYAQIGAIPPRRSGLFIPRFREIVNYIQLATMEVKDQLEKAKERLLTLDELKILEERKKYAHIWIGNYAPDSYRLQISESVPDGVKDLTSEQKKFLEKTIFLIEEETNPDSLQLALYNMSKELNLESKKAFSAIYIALIGKEYGPRAAWFMLQYPKEQVIQRLKEVSGT